jgi:hypothetical protein
MAVAKLSEFVKRYTKLEHAVDALKTKELAVPDPSKWDDSNDQEFVEIYRGHISAQSVYAMCCTMSPERYHHWRVFTDKDKADGVCIEFKRQPLQNALSRIRTIRAEPVDYVSLKKMRELSHRPENLPFIKRSGYKDEREWRILVVSPDAQQDLIHVPFSLDWIHRIILNPWMREKEREAARSMLKSLIEEPTRITATYLRNSAEWKKLGTALLR